MTPAFGHRGETARRPRLRPEDVAPAAQPIEVRGALASAGILARRPSSAWDSGGLEEAVVLTNVEIRKTRRGDSRTFWSTPRGASVESLWFPQLRCLPTPWSMLVPRSISPPPSPPDSDSDGFEDRNADGSVGPNETDPTLPEDDGDAPLDIEEDALDDRDRTTGASNDDRAGSDRPPGGDEVAVDSPPATGFESGARLRGSPLCAATSPRTTRSEIPVAAGLLLLGALAVVAALRRRAAAPALLVAVALGSAAPSNATASTAVALGRFHLNHDGLGVFATESGEILPHLGFSFGAMYSAGRDPIAVVRGGDVVHRPVGWRMDVDVVAAIGLVDWIEVAMRLPLSPYQEAGDPDGAGTLRDWGLGDLGAQIKVRFCTAARHGIAFSLLLPGTFPTGESDGYLGWNSFSFSPQVALSRRFGPVVVAANVGYALLPARTLVRAGDYELTVDDELVYRVGLSISPRDAIWHVGLEAVGAAYVAGTARSELTSMEILAGTGLVIDQSLRLTAGAGVQALGGYGTPAFRGFFAASYTYGAVGDSDGDGIPDEEDHCMDLAEDRDGRHDEDGCPDEDDDQDGVPDAQDECPIAAEDEDQFEDEDGCPDRDNDLDGVRDDVDACPLVEEDRDGFEDEDGCPEPDPTPAPTPEAPAPRAAADPVIPLSGPIRFVGPTAQLEPETNVVLDDVVRYLRDHPEVRRVRIEGHTSRSGRFRLNLRLSERRARRVMLYLVQEGVDPDRLEATGLAWKEPRVPQEEAGSAQLNARVELRILR